jgi:hypothetical protein
MGSGSTLVVAGSYICYNRARNGGAFFNTGSGGSANQGGSTMLVSGTSIYENSATGSGGAIWNLAGSVTVLGDTFTSNSAAGGGAIWNSGTLSVGACTFSGNTASTITGSYDNEGGNIGL